MAAADYNDAIQKLYIAYYNRPADVGGLAYWSAVADAVDGDLDSIMNAFGTSAESSALYDGVGTEEIIQQIYQAIFNREGEAAGVAFYVAKVAAGDMTTATIALNILNGAQNDDLAIATAKLAVANEFTAGLANDPDAAIAYNAGGTAVVALARAMLAEVISADSDVDVDAVLTAIVDEDSTDVGETFTLTTDEDTFAGTTGDDTFVATNDTMDGEDRVVDSSTADDDVLTLAADSDPAAIDVTNVENIAITWTGFGTPDIDLDNVSGATVSLTSTKAGYLGDVNFINVGSNSISVGAGVTGTVDIDTFEDATITATVAEEIIVTNGDNEITIEAGIADTISVEGGDDVTITGTALSSIEVLGTQDTINLTLGVDADLNVNSAEGVVTIDSEDDITITLDAASALAEIEATGDGAVGITYADSDDVTADTISIGGSVTLNNAVTVALDLSAVDAESIIFASTSAALTHTFADSANVVASVAFGADVVLQMDAEDDGEADAITFTTGVAQTEILTFTNFETVTLVNGGDAEDAEGIILDEVDAGTNTLVLESSGEADLTITLVTASEIDATAVSTGLTLTQSAEDADLTVVGGEGGTDITFTAAASEITFVSEGDGDNTINADTLTTGSFAVITGGGADTVTVDALTSGDVSLELGDGENSFSILGTVGTTILAAAEIVVTMGEDDDEFVVIGTIDAESTLSVDLGDGTNTLDLSGGANLTAGDVSIDGISVIAIGTAGDDATADGIDAEADATGEGDVTVFVDGDLLDGATYSITAGGLDAESTFDSMLGVEIDSEGSYDYSGLVMSTGIDDGIGGLLIFFSAEGAEGVDLRMSDAGDFSDAADADVTYTILAGDSVASSDATFDDTADIAADDTIEFLMGVDVIVNFDVEDDFIAFVNGDGETAAVTAIGLDAEDLTEDTIFFLSGAWDTDTMIFTIDADGDGADTLVFENQDTSAMDNITTATNMVVLIGIGSGDLTAGDRKSVV